VEIRISEFYDSRINTNKMVKRITTGKRDREKAKQQKRQEKLKRKEERKSNGTSSFDDMIAYVDEFGNLSSTPVEKPKEEIDASTIDISTPKQEDVEPEVFQGRVQHYNSQKGYGFIEEAQSKETYFFHYTEAPAEIAEEDKVEFELEQGQRGLNAVRIKIVK
jgi:cold shock CspA family protein